MENVEQVSDEQHQQVSARVLDLVRHNFETAETDFKIESEGEVVVQFTFKLTPEEAQRLIHG